MDDYISLLSYTNSFLNRWLYILMIRSELVKYVWHTTSSMGFLRVNHGGYLKPMVSVDACVFL